MVVGELLLARVVVGLEHVLDAFEQLAVYEGLVLPRVPKETRLYMAAPWPFATILGWHLGSAGPLVMREASVERDSYRVSCVLR